LTELPVPTLRFKHVIKIEVIDIVRSKNLLTHSLTAYILEIAFSGFVLFHRHVCMCLFGLNIYFDLLICKSTAQF